MVNFYQQPLSCLCVYRDHFVRPVALSKDLMGTLTKPLKSEYTKICSSSTTVVFVEDINQSKSFVVKSFEIISENLVF